MDLGGARRLTISRLALLGVVGDEKAPGQKPPRLEGWFVRNGGLTRGWMSVAGVVLVAIGLLGFVDNPLVGGQEGALVPTDAAHDVMHLATGLLALAIAFGVRGSNRINGTVGFGVLYLVIFVAVLISPTLFGVFSVPADGTIHLINGMLAFASIAMGAIERRTARVPATG